MRRKAIICDIDGVLLNTEHIFKKIEDLGLLGADMWQYFNRHANDWDVEIDERVISLLNAFSKAGVRIIFVTARTVEIYHHTRAKIQLAIGQFSDSIFPFDLFMRDAKDYRESCEVKQDILNELKTQYDIVCAIDDERANCEMFAKNKILTMRVIKGKEKEQC